MMIKDIRFSKSNILFLSIFVRKIFLKIYIKRLTNEFCYVIMAAKNKFWRSQIWQKKSLTQWR